MKKHTVCLNMIVKNESRVIQRCLSSVKDLIDYWVIIDTGSTDGTQEIIEQYLNDIPGELHERPWVNFGHNRNEALVLARKKADYFLFIDADDRLIFSETFNLPDLNSDFYLVTQHMKHMYDEGFANNPVILLMKDLPDVHWEGAVHEALVWEGTKNSVLLSGVVNEYRHDGDRAKDPDAHRKDIQMLEASIQRDPTNCRDVFFLAQTYGSANDYSSAIQYYEKRIDMGGRDDEVFYSMLAIGALQKKMNSSSEVVIASLCNAYTYRPSRTESLYELSELLIANENYLLGYLVSMFALSIPFPDDPFELFVVPWVYHWGTQLQFYRCARQLGNYRKAYETLCALLANPHFSTSRRLSVESDLPHLELMLKRG